MTGTSDFLGRVWPDDKLDRLLSDPAVSMAVEEMDRAGRGSGRVFQAARARDWAYAKGRSEAGFALLLLLRRRWFAQNVRRSA